MGRNAERGQPLSQDTSIALKTLVLGSANQPLPSGWVGQSFRFQSPSSRSTTIDAHGCSFGLIQNKGGPCGLLAVVQAHILKVKSNIINIYFLLQQHFKIYNAFA